MEEVIEERAELVERVAAVDIGKAMLVACARVAVNDGRKLTPWRRVKLTPFRS